MLFSAFGFSSLESLTFASHLVNWSKAENGVSTTTKVIK